MSLIDNKVKSEREKLEKLKKDYKSKQQNTLVCVISVIYSFIFFKKEKWNVNS